MRFPTNALATFFVILVACNLIESDENKPPCPPILIVPESPYDSPVWHPSGQFIGFNHTILDSITYPYGEYCIGQQHFNYDSSGFWFIDADGSNMKRVLPYRLDLPAWSPDGEWIAFVSAAQIFKMRFDMVSGSFDTTSLVQLTHEGHNFFPDWSPDGQLITYLRSYSYPEPSSVSGIWMMEVTGMAMRQLYKGNSSNPTWHPDGDRLMFMRGVIDTVGHVYGDSLWQHVIASNLNQALIFISGYNYHPKCSPDGTSIIFSSQSPSNGRDTLWLMDIDGTNFRALHTTGVYIEELPYSWNPEATTIAFVSYSGRIDGWTCENGTIWTLNVFSGEKRQLTFNCQSHR